METQSPSIDELPDQEVLTAKELATWQRVEEEWIVKNSRARRIPGAYKVGRYWRYRRADVQRQILATNQLLQRKAR